MPPCVVFAANRGFALTRSRKTLIQRFLAAEWEVVLAVPADAEARALRDLGARLEPVPFRRGGPAPMADGRAYRRLAAIYRKWRPSLVQHFHAKPVILGSVAARRALGGSVRIVNGITGLGYAFQGSGPVARVAGWGYGLALPRADAVIFQNSDDRRLFLDRGWVTSAQARLIAGSGVDTAHFQAVDRTGRAGRAPVVLMLGRLLWQKGIRELVEVAARLHRDWPGTRVLLAGEPEAHHPDGVPPDWLARQAGIEYLGCLSDVRPLLTEADLFLYPSRYREGVPRAVLEAAATALPTVAFDVPGVREAVRHGETGRLAPAGDLTALAEGTRALLADDPQRLAMGRSARRLVETDFDIQAIEAQYRALYRELGAAIP